MKRLAIFAGGAVALALAGCTTSGGGEGVAEIVAPTLHAELIGSAEVPGPGDPDGSGKAEVSIVDATDNVCYEIKEVRGLSAVTAAHIHRGATGVAGPPVVMLETPTDGHSKSCARADGSLADEIKKNPGGFYVNIHSSEFPDGAIRGQLHN